MTTMNIFISATVVFWTRKRRMGEKFSGAVAMDGYSPVLRGCWKICLRIILEEKNLNGCLKIWRQRSLLSSNPMVAGTHRCSNRKATRSKKCAVRDFILMGLSEDS